MAKILYIGPDAGTSRHRFDALLRLGHDVRLVDPFAALGHSTLLMSIAFKTGYVGWERRISDAVCSAIACDLFDVVWVDNGEQIGRGLVRKLKSSAKYVLNLNLDNPFTGRDGLRWRLFRQALSEYDLFVTPRATTHQAALRNGARRALVVMFSADEKVHRRITLTESEQRQFGSEVAFVGTWMPERGPFLRRLLERGVPLRIFGPRWRKAPEYPFLSPIVEVGFLDDAKYVKAVSGAKIALGLLSLGNEDLHTTRSMEIPAIGSLLCAPKTVDHEALYADGIEAIFFDNVEDCADKCLAALADDARRIAVSQAGHRRARQNNWYNERLCANILAAL